MKNKNSSSQKKQSSEKTTPTSPVVDSLRPQDFPLTDYGNAQRLVYYYGDKLMHVHTWHKTYMWTQQCWREMTDLELEKLACAVTEHMMLEAVEIRDEDRQREHFKWLMRSQMGQRVRDMVQLAKGLMTQKTPDDIDSDPWRLLLLNGELNLHTGELEPFTKEHYLTSVIPITYDEKATCPSWLAFLERIFRAREEMIEFLQRCVGYTLTGDVSEQCLFFMCGTGANGKTTFVETIMSLLGSLAVKAPADMLLRGAGTTIPNDVARLKGKRMVVAAELVSKRLNESLVKDLTGYDRIVARFLHQEFFEFFPTHKLWMYGNHKPIISDTDEGIWRRIRLIPFMEFIKPEERKPHLVLKLREELPGILNWAIEGCRNWQQIGLTQPEEVKAATLIYRQDMDVFGRFLSEMCSVEVREGVQEAARDLYSAYYKWCMDNGERPRSQTWFGIKLREQGFAKTVKADGVWWEGIVLKSSISRLFSDFKTKIQDNDIKLDEEVPF